MIRFATQLALAAASTRGCDGGTSATEAGATEVVGESPRPIIDPSAWVDSLPADDPLADHRPDDLVCNPGAWATELDGVELDTGECNYFSLVQPLLGSVARGDELHVVAWWTTLVSEAPDVGHVALFIGPVLIWERYVPIPGPADVADAWTTSPVDANAQTPVTLHLHNHGSNTWHVNELSRRTGRV